MTKKMTQGEFVRMLFKKAGIARDEDFGKILGVTKSAVGLWKNGKSPIPIEKFLTAFGQETLDWIKQEYDLADKKPDFDSEELLLAEARKIQILFDRGLIKLDLSEVSDGGESKPNKGRAQETAITIPVYSHAIAAGEPATCSCTIEEYITISANRVKHPKETYAVKAYGDSMKDAGILEGDLLIVDRAIEPKNNHIVIASINDEQTVKRLKVKKGSISLVPENSKYNPIEITGEMDFRILGVVTYVIRKTV